jgi:peptidoglycan/LPS O-acetylase OafA/YrhL
MKRQLSLDVLRGIAVLLVIVRHCPETGPIMGIIKTGGWIGVDLFFVLSGFLVSGLLFKQFEKKGELHPVQFLVRRAFKIYPAFWAFIGLTIAATVAFGGGFSFTKTWPELLFVQSYVQERLWPHTWSLAVEEHFYILLPIMLVPLSKTKFKGLPRIVFAIMVGLLIAKCINGLRPFSQQTHLFPTHLRLDGLFFGVLLSHWHHSWASFNDFCTKNSRNLIGIGILGMLPAFAFEVHDTPWLYTVGLTVQILAAGAILMGMVCRQVPENKITLSLGYIGKYSYSIYLWHNAVIFFLAPILGFSGVNAVFFSLAVSTGIGMLMSNLVEVPVLKLRDWITDPQRGKMKPCTIIQG